jgi:hypothetical protein
MRDSYDLGVTGCDFFGSASRDRIDLEDITERTLNPTNRQTGLEASSSGPWGEAFFSERQRERISEEVFQKGTQFTRFRRKGVSVSTGTCIDRVGDVEDMRGEQMAGSSPLSRMVSGEVPVLISKSSGSY